MSKDEVLKALNELRGQLNPVGGQTFDHEEDDEEEFDGERLLVAAEEIHSSSQAPMEND
jgi:hypothetical protein